MSLRKVTLMLVVLGAAAFAAGAFFAVQSWPIAHGSQADGKVVELEHGGGSRGGSTPIVEFTAKDSKSHRFTGNVSSRPPQYLIGDDVDVRYVTDDPDEASIDAFQELWLIPAIFLPASLGMFGLAWLVSRFGGMAQRLQQQGASFE